MVEDVTHVHRQVLTCCWWSDQWGNFESIVNVLVECVVACLVYVFSSLEVVFYSGEFCINGGLLITCVWRQVTVRIEFVWVCWCCSYWGNVEMEWMWVDQDVHLRQHDAHPLTAHCGYGIFLNAFVK